MKSNDFINEDIVGDAHTMHQDHEVSMAREELYHAAASAMKVHKLLKDVSEQQGIEGWVAEKITLAGDYLHTVADYLEGQKMDAEDAMAQQGMMETRGPLKKLKESQWGSPEEICQQVLHHLERDVEWPLTEIMEPRTVHMLLAPVTSAVNDKLKEVAGAVNENSAASFAGVPATGKGPNVGTLFGGSYKPKTPFSAKKKKTK